MTQLKQNTADLDTLIEKANALPDVGGGTIETCTLTITSTFNQESQDLIFYLTRFVNGQYESAMMTFYGDEGGGTKTMTDVVNMSIVAQANPGMYPDIIDSNGITEFFDYWGYGVAGFYVNSGISQASITFG